MRNQWLATELNKLKTPENEAVIQAALDYIQELEDDNESLQISLEGTIWSPEKWRDDWKEE